MDSSGITWTGRSDLHFLALPQWTHLDGKGPKNMQVVSDRSIRFGIPELLLVAARGTKHESNSVSGAGKNAILVAVQLRHSPLEFSDITASGGRAGYREGVPGRRR